MCGRKTSEHKPSFLFARWANTTDCAGTGTGVAVQRVIGLAEKSRDNRRECLNCRTAPFSRHVMYKGLKGDKKTGSAIARASESAQKGFFALSLSV